MEDEEEEIDFEELSKEYPLFFSPANKTSMGKLYPSPSSQVPVDEKVEPKLYLDYGDYLLDEKITKLSYYPVKEKNKVTFEGKSFPKEEISPLSQTSRPPKQSFRAAKRPNMAKTSKTNIISFPRYNEKVTVEPKPAEKVKDLTPTKRETGVQTPRNLEKKKFNIPPPSPPPLHSGYHINFDYTPKHEQRTQKMQNGSEKVYYLNGDMLINYPNGKVKIQHQNTITTRYKNGDVLQEFADGATAYRYHKSGTIELKLTDGTSILEFANGQREKRNAEGETIVNFGDGKFMKVDADGKWTIMDSKTKYGQV